MSPTSYQTAPPRDKAGAKVYDRTLGGSINLHLQESPLTRAFLLQLVPRRGLEPLHPMGTTTSRLRVYQFHHLGNTTLKPVTSALEPEEHRYCCQLRSSVAAAPGAPVHHLLPVCFAELPKPLDLANLLESADELSL